jgi:hypothetical protein
MIRTTLAEKERSLARRKTELGIVGRNYVAVNSDARRTDAKRELLRALEREAQARGVVSRFGAAMESSSPQNARCVTDQ